MVVESVSAVASSTNATVTITKPAGLVVGDLLIATLSSFAVDGSGAGSISLKSGWTDAETTEHASEMSHSIQYKVADSGDVAASNFAFTRSSSSDFFTGQLIRASGQNTLDPLGTTGVYTNASASSASFAGTLSSYTPGVDGALVVTQYGVVWTSGATQRDFSSYAATNVTFTEGIDTSGNDGSGGAATASAYGIQSTDAALSTFTATLNIATSEHYGQIAVFLPPVDVSGTNTLVTTDTTMFTHTGTCDGVVGNTLTEATAETFTQNGQGTSPTPWINDTKPNTTYINDQK